MYQHLTTLTAFKERQQMYLAYTYHICNKITKEFYYGSRYKNVTLKRTPQDDFWIYYFTSSNKVKNLINLYGKESFDVSIIMENEDYDKCYFYEQNLIDSHLSNALCLNKFCHLTNKFSMAGSAHSEETKAKLSIARQKRIGPNTGKTHTEETKAKIGAAQKGKTISNEHKASIRDARKNQIAPNIGKMCSDETKAKLSIANKGKPSPMKGRKHSEETKAKIAAAKLGANNPNFKKTG
jgi:hypothetical protein